MELILTYMRCLFIAVMCTFACSNCLSNGFRWQLSSGSKSVEVFGVVHGTIAPDLLALIASRNISSEDTVVFEFNDWNSENTKSYISALNQMTMLDLSIESQSKAKEMLERFGVHEKLFSEIFRQHPASAINMFVNVVARHRSARVSSTENEVFQLSKARGAVIRFLESSTDAAANMNSITVSQLEQTIGAVSALARSADRRDFELKWLTRASTYVANQDAESFCADYKSYYSSDIAISKFEDLLIHSRNSKFATQISSIVSNERKPGRVFVFVGIVHMCPLFGLREALESKEFDISPGKK